MESRAGTVLGWAWPLVGWLVGLGLLQQCPRLPGEGEFAALALLIIGLAWLRRRWSWVALPLALLLALAWGSWRAEQRLAEELPIAWEGRDVWLQGQVASLPQALQGQSGAPGWRFRFRVEQALDERGQVLPAIPQELLLSQYAQGDQALQAWRAGQRWALVARLRRPHALANPHAFDYELWLLEQGVRATGVLRPVVPRRLADSPWPQIDGLRQDLREAIQRRIADPGNAGLLSALSLGDQQAIGRRDWTLYRNTSTSHLMAISGLHVTMLAWAAESLIFALWRRSGRVCLWLPAPTAACWAGAATAGAYALFAGWGVPAQRTVWMLVGLALLRNAGLRWPWPLHLLAAATLVTVIDPWAVAQAGFWLSFAAVGLLMAGGQPAPQGWRAHLVAGLRAQWVATLGLAPLSLLFFQQISLVGLLANLLAIPLVSLVITPLALGGALMPGLWHAAAWCAEALRWYLQLLEGLPGAVWWLPVAPLWAQALGLLAGALLVLPLPWRLRWLGPLLALALLWPAPSRPASGRFELLAPDVGQGMAVLVRTEHHALLFDAGPQWGPDSDAGQRVLLPLLQAIGQPRLDVLMLSHRDTDHVGGAAALLNGLAVEAMSSSLAPEHPLLRGRAHRRCEAGQQWEWDGVRFEVLQPAATDYRESAKSNSLSCVLRVSDPQGRSALLAGDIEAAQERALIASGQALRSDLLLVPHHGSKTSSTAEFLAAVAPSMALVQAGYRNRFGHPAIEVLARYQAQGIRVWGSPDCGAWSWRSADASPRCQREVDRRYWQHRPVQDAVPGAELPGAGEGGGTGG